MIVTQYLDRIGLTPSAIWENLEALRSLQAAHLMSVPFENLDIQWERPITLDTAEFCKKVISEKRGGFCYELNGALNVLLREIGFQTRLVSARVFTGAGLYSPEFAHAAIIVTLCELEYLVDVGFGDFTAGPLPILADLEHFDREGTFKLGLGEFGEFEVRKLAGDEFVPQYSFGTQGRNLSEFTEMCEFQQYSPESHFTKGKVCSLMTAVGRKTLTDAKFITTANGVKTEKEISSEKEFYDLLDLEFNIRRPH